MASIAKIIDFMGQLMSTNLQAYRIVSSSNKRYRPTEIGELIIAIINMLICLDNEIKFRIVKIKRKIQFQTNIKS